MISKERLEELIEQGATIYELYNKDILQVKLEKEFFVINGGLYKSRYAFRTWWIKDLYETMEDVEFAKEFGCIERTERLELPTWEELQNKKEFYLGFNNKEGIVRYYLAIDIPYQKDFGAILISYSDTNNYTIICFDKIATKENYILACRKAKELFLGEKE